MRTLTLQPGVNVELTRTANTAGWSSSNCIRWRNNLPEKLGGWSHFGNSPLVGLGRGMTGWADLSGNPYLAVGTEQRLLLSGADQVIDDITPREHIDNVPAGLPVTTTGSISANTNSLTVADPTNIEVNGTLIVAGAGVAGVNLISVVTHVAGATITLQTGASTTVSGAAVTGGGSFSTVMGSNVVTIAYDPPIAFPVAAGGWLEIFTDVSVGGLILQGIYEIQSVETINVSASVFGLSITIHAASNATSTATARGQVARFQTGTSLILVTLPNHGLSAGGFFTVHVPTVLRNLNLVGTYEVLGLATLPAAPSDPTTNQFFISTGLQPDISGRVSAENHGNAQIQYFVPNGQVVPVYATGYGIGPYGAGPYGEPNDPPYTSTTVTVPIRQWTLDHWGQDLIGNYTGSTVYVWIPPWQDGSYFTAIIGTGVPQAVNSSFVAMPQQILVAMGCDQGTNQQDPNLIRWSDVANYTVWNASATNQAGSFRIPTGSKIVGGLQAPQFGMIWTDIDTWLMQYLGFPLVFGFTKIAGGAGLLATRASGIYAGMIFWASKDNFFVFNGASAAPIPNCTVWEVFFRNLNTFCSDKVWCWVNSLFGEIYWFFPYGASTECNAYVKYNVLWNVWDYGYIDFAGAPTTLARTCGIDLSPVGNPMSCDVASLIQQHEIGFDADGALMNEFVASGFMSDSDGTMFTYLDRIVPDFIYEGTPGNVYGYVMSQDYPSGTQEVFGPYAFGPTTPRYAIVRKRNRELSMSFANSDLGVFWRMGAVRWKTSPAGRR